MMFREINMIKMRSVVLLAIMAGMAVVTVIMRPMLLDMFNSPQFQQTIKNLPGAQGLTKTLSSYAYYSYSQWFAKSFTQIAALIAIILSFSVFSKERDKKTLYLLTGRMTRWQIFSSKLFSGYAVMAIISIAGGLVYYVTSAFMHYEISGTMVLVWTLRTTVGSLLFYQIGAYASLLFKDQIKPFLVYIVVVAGITVAPMFEQFKFLDLFGYMGGSDVLQTPSLNFVPFISIVLVCAALFTLEYIQFKRTDL